MNTVKFLPSALSNLTDTFVCVYVYLKMVNPNLCQQLITVNTFWSLKIIFTDVVFLDKISELLRVDFCCCIVCRSKFWDVRNLNLNPARRIDVSRNISLISCKSACRALTMISYPEPRSPTIFLSKTLH